MTKIAVIGAGAWGTTLALVLHRQGSRVMLCEKFPEYALVLAEKRENVKFLSGIKIPEGIEITSIPGETKSADAFILAPPSFALRNTAAELKRAGVKGPFLIVTKGLEQETGLRMSEVLQSEFGPAPVAALSGPTIAREVAGGLPAAAVCSSPDVGLSVFFQSALNSEKFRIYTSADMVGVELGGALKNPMAIAAGIAEGLGLGENTKAALLCRGLAEISRLGKKAGGNERTFFGLSGLGDLLTTAGSPLSRNHRFGLAVGRGEPPDKIIKSGESVVEGYHTVKPALVLAEKLQVEMPIIGQVAEVLFNGKRPDQAVYDLMSRPMKEE